MNEGPSQKQQFSWTEQFTVNLRDLSSQIYESFNLEELENLCFNLDIKYGDIEGKTRIAKARSLTTYCKRQGKLPDLVKACKLARPKVSWAELNIVSLDQEVSQGSSQRDFRTFWISAIAGVIFAGAIALAWYFFVLERPSGLDRYLETIVEYSFDNPDKPLGISEAQPDFVIGISQIETNPSDWSIEVKLDLPEVTPGEPISSFAGGICVPIDKEVPIDAVSSILRAPKGVNTLTAILYATVGEEHYFNEFTKLEQDKWTPVFWGAKFGYFGDKWSDWDGKGATEVCLWVASDEPYKGLVQIDDVIIYQKKQIVE